LFSKEESPRVKPLLFPELAATNVQGEARKPLVALGRKYHCLQVAIVFDLPEKALPSYCSDRTFGPHVIRQQASSWDFARSSFSLTLNKAEQRRKDAEEMNLPTRAPELFQLLQDSIRAHVRRIQSTQMASAVQTRTINLTKMKIVQLAVDGGQED
jgi:hypothetical protein